MIWNLLFYLRIRSKWVVVIRRCSRSFSRRCFFIFFIVCLEKSFNYLLWMSWYSVDGGFIKNLRFGWCAWRISNRRIKTSRASAVFFGCLILWCGSEWGKIILCCSMISWRCVWWFFWLKGVCVEVFRCCRLGKKVLKVL